RDRGCSGTVVHTDDTVRSGLEHVIRKVCGVSRKITPATKVSGSLQPPLTATGTPSVSVTTHESDPTAARSTPPASVSASSQAPPTARSAAEVSCGPATGGQDSAAAVTVDKNVAPSHSLRSSGSGLVGRSGS